MSVDWISFDWQKAFDESPQGTDKEVGVPGWCWGRLLTWNESYLTVRELKTRQGRLFK